MSPITIAFISIVANVVTVVGGLISLIILVRKNGVNDGRQIEILSNLQSIATDHESRIRVLESHRSANV